MSDCSTSAMSKHEIHCRNKRNCIDHGVIVPEECFRHCHGGDSDEVRFAALVELAREMFWCIRDLLDFLDRTGEKYMRDGHYFFTEIFAEELEALGVSVDDTETS